MAAYMRKTGILPVCTNDEARDYFAGKGLSYDDVTEGDILALVMLLNKHIKKENMNFPSKKCKKDLRPVSCRSQALVVFADMYFKFTVQEIPLRV